MMIDYQSTGTLVGMTYESQLLGATWSKPGLIDSTSSGVIDSKGSHYSTPSACLSPDGKTLYFASDRSWWHRRIRFV